MRFVLCVYVLLLPAILTSTARSLEWKSRPTVEVFACSFEAKLREEVLELKSEGVKVKCIKKDTELSKQSDLVWAEKAETICLHVLKSYQNIAGK